MKRNRFFVMAMLGMALIFGIVLAGCENPSSPRVNIDTPGTGGNGTDTGGTDPGNTAPSAPPTVPLDTSSLAGAITSAEAALAAVQVEYDDTTPNGTSYVTLAEKNAYQSAINAAKGVRDNAGADQAAITQALNDLIAADEVFNDALLSHTVYVDANALAEEIGNLQTWLDGMTIAANADTVPLGTPYLTSNQKGIVQDKINAAIAVWDSAVRTGAQVTAQIDSIGLAKMPYASQNGTLSDKPALNTAITDAQSALAAVSGAIPDASTPNGTRYVSSAEASAYLSAITTAQGVYTGGSTAEAVSQALTSLAAATTIFNAAIQTWNVDITALDMAITDAQSALAAVTVDPGASTPHGTNYIINAEKTAYQNAINTAAGVRDNGSRTQTQVTQAVSNLSAATGTFNSAKAKTWSVSTTALNTAIRNLQTWLDDITIGDTAASVPAGTHYLTNAQKTALQGIINAAIAVRDNAARTNAQVSTQTSNLSSSDTTYKGYYNSQIGIPPFPSTSLPEALTWLSSYAVSGQTYTITLPGDVSIAPQTLSYSGRTGVTITLKGNSTVRTVQLIGQGSLFTVESGVKLVLDENITLKGINTNTAPLVRVNNNGTLEMRKNAKITGNTNAAGSDYGGGVFVGSGGTFTMNDSAMVSGNTISGSSALPPSGGGVCVVGTFTMNDSAMVSGNTTSGSSSGVTPSGGGVWVIGTFTMNDSAIVSGNTASGSYLSSAYGGGVFVVDIGTFTMNDNATVSGNTASSFYSAGGTPDSGSYSHGGGVCVWYNGTFTMNDGAMVSGNTTSASGFSSWSSGSGVFVWGTFTMKGGTIYGSDGGAHANKLNGSGQGISLLKNNFSTAQYGNGQPIITGDQAANLYTDDTIRGQN